MTTSTAMSTSGGFVPKLLACGAGVTAAVITKNPLFASPCLLLFADCGGDDPTATRPLPQKMCEASCENVRAEYSTTQTLPAKGRMVEIPGGYFILSWDKIQKLDCAGQIKWEKDLTGLDIYGIHGLSGTKDGGVVIAALSQNRDEVGLIIKLDNNGNLQWRKKGLQFDSVELVSQANDGGYFFVNNESIRFFISRLDSQGDPTGPQRVFYNEIQAISSFMDASNHAETIIAGLGAHIGRPLWMARVNQVTGDISEGDGNQGTVDTEINGHLQVQQVIRAVDGAYVVVGHRRPDESKSVDHFFVVRSRSDFVPIWERQGDVSYGRSAFIGKFPKLFLGESRGSGNIHLGRLEGEGYEGTSYVGHKTALVTSFGPDGNVVGSDAAVMANEGWIFGSLALFGGSVVYTQEPRGENSTIASFHRVCLP